MSWNKDLFIGLTSVSILAVTPFSEGRYIWIENLERLGPKPLKESAPNSTLPAAEFWRPDDREKFIEVK